MQVVDTLKLLMALLGPSWRLLGRSGPKMDPQNCSKNDPASVQKLVQKITPNIPKNKVILGPEIEPKINQDSEAGAQSQAARAILEVLGPKMPPRWLKMAPRGPR